MGGSPRETVARGLVGPEGGSLRDQIPQRERFPRSGAGPATAASYQHHSLDEYLVKNGADVPDVGNAVIEVIPHILAKKGYASSRM